jgi:GTP pyrophosphokinase
MRRLKMLMSETKKVELANMVTAPYMALATMLICKGRKASGNQFRHMCDTRAILIDYGYIDSVLHKAALTHDLIEDLEDFDTNLLINADAEGREVYELVLEVTRRKNETKPAYLERIMQDGSLKAKLIKCADRISNMKDIGFYTDPAFIQRYCDETEKYILPMASHIDADMYTELADLIESRREFLSLVVLLSARRPSPSPAQGGYRGAEK